jgi:hypothetical protein
LAKKPNSGKGDQKKKLTKTARQLPLSHAGASSSFLTKWSPVVLLIFSSLVFLIARIRLLAMPLERDEGSFAYIGHWLLRGRELYTDMLDSKLPGLYTIYGIFTTLFGLTPTGVHMALLISNIVSAVCFYYLVKELYNRQTASITTSFFLFLVVSLNIGGFASHATQLLTPFILGGSLLFWRGIQSGRGFLFLLAGLCIGIAFTIKQQAAIYGILLALIWWPARLIWYRKENAKLPFLEWIWLGIGGLLPLLLVVGYFFSSDRFDEFYNWTVTQPFHLAGSFAEPKYKILFRILPRIIQQFEGLYILAGAGLIFTFLSGYKKGSSWFGFFFAILGILSVVIGTAYYNHYFVLAMPGIALLAAISLDWISRKTGKYGSLLGIAIALGLVVLSMRGRSDYYFNPDYAKIHFEVYNRNMFPEIEKIGRELAKRVPEGQRIGVMGSEPEVLVAAGRESCSRHLMVYSLLSDPELSPPLQQEYVGEMKECAPEYIVWNTISSSWTAGYDQLKFFKEFMVWVEQNYKVIGLAESRDDKPGVIVWDKALDTHQSISNFKVFVLQKKGIAEAPVQ